MGLFGGFKAKFTKDSKTKDKSHNNVVVLKYYSYPEFDTPYHRESLPKNNTKNGDVHENQKTEAMPIVDSMASEHSNNVRDRIKKSSSMNSIATEPKATSKGDAEISKEIGTKPTSSKKNVAPEIPPNRNSEKDNNVADTLQASTQKQVNKQSNDSTQSRIGIPKGVDLEGDFQSLSSSKSIRNIPISEQSPPTNNSYHNDRSEYEDQSTLIFMTQQNSDTRNVAESDGEIYATLPIDLGHDKNDEFKVNVVQHDRNRTQSFSEDEISYVEDELTTNFSAMGYSSQATSIFFQGDMQPTITRPRRRLFEDNDEDEEDDDQSRSDNEADC